VVGAPDTAGLLGTVVAARRSRAAAVISGLALLGGSLLQRLGVIEAGVASTKDRRYVVVPQRQCLNDGAHGNVWCWWIESVETCVFGSVTVSHL
jgi:hypothetical protein